MSAIMEVIHGLPSGAAGVFGVLTLVIALLQCFMGYKLLKLWVTLAGAAIGVIIGIIVGNVFIKNATATTVLALVLLLVGGFLAFKVYKAGVFLLCGLTVYVLVMGILMSAAGTDAVWWMEVISIIAGIVAGILGVKFMRVFIILSTAIPNGLSAGASLMTMLKITGQVQIVIVGVVLAALGTLVQFVTTKEKE